MGASDSDFMVCTNRILLTEVCRAKFGWRRCYTVMVNFRQPSHEFTFGVGMSFISFPLVLTPLV
jgi:hypothetical protein